MKFILTHDLARQNATKAVQEAPSGHIVEIKEPSRTLAENALLHAILTDLSKQAKWHG
jgi:regulator of RNase E activity RraA